MTLSRRTALKLGIGAGALPLLGTRVLGAAETPAPAPPPEGGLIRARPLPLTAVRLTGGPLKQALDLNSAYLLALEPDRMLSYFRQRAGLTPKAEGYGGWDGGGRNLTGHIAGHYLSAIAYMYATTGDPRFKERVDYMVSELKQVQDANGDGSLMALEGGKEAFARLARGELRSGSFDLNGQWSPWYTLHKLYAGLRDAYRFTGNKTALQLEVNWGQWAENILKDLSDAQLQFMMNTEFGGMNEVAVDLYADTGDARWLALAQKFEHRVFIEPLKRNVDHLGGCHGNTAVPKIMGNIDRYICTGSTEDLVAANFFWNRVVQHHSFSSGGHGKDEYFGPPDQLADRVDGRTAESCNVYNMLKLTRLLFSLSPDPHYADFHERALFNHVMASIDPEDGRTCYMVPVGRGVTREYQDMMRSFTCCVGSGMESHALHADGIYYEDGDKFWVNLYAPSTAQWTEAGVSLTAETDMPEGDQAKLSFQVKSPKEFTLALRHPWWAGEGFAVKVNGQPVDVTPAVTMPVPGGSMELAGRSQYTPYQSSRYVEVKRTWRTGDVVELTLPEEPPARAHARQSAARLHHVGPARAGRRSRAGAAAHARPAAGPGAQRGGAGARGRGPAGHRVGAAGGRHHGQLPDGGRRPRAECRWRGEGSGPASHVPGAAPHLCHLLRSLHAGGVAVEAGRVPGRGGADPQAGGGQRRLRAARRPGLRVTVQLPGRGWRSGAAHAEPRWAARQQLVLL